MIVKVIRICLYYLKVKILPIRMNPTQYDINVKRALLLDERRYVQGVPKSVRKKSNISLTARANELISLSMIEACLNFISVLTCLDRPFVKHHYWSQQIKIYFFTGRKRNSILNEGSL